MSRRANNNNTPPNRGVFHDASSSSFGSVSDPTHSSSWLPAASMPQHDRLQYAEHPYYQRQQYGRPPNNDAGGGGPVRRRPPTAASSPYQRQRHRAHGGGDGGNFFGGGFLGAEDDNTTVVSSNGSSSVNSSPRSNFSRKSSLSSLPPPSPYRRRGSGEAGGGGERLMRGRGYSGSSSVSSSSAGGGVGRHVRPPPRQPPPPSPSARSARSAQEFSPSVRRHQYHGRHQPHGVGQQAPHQQPLHPSLKVTPLRRPVRANVGKSPALVLDPRNTSSSSAGSSRAGDAGPSLFDADDDDAPPPPPPPPPSAVSDSSSSFNRGAGGASAMVQRLLQGVASSRGRRDEPPTPQEAPRREEGGDATAAAFARSAPKAGFLCKLGDNIPEYKRRFFVLKPAAHLYYFLSPNDSEPRGCVDLESSGTVGGAEVREVETLPDGRFRFEILLPPGGEGGGGGNRGGGQRRRIVLEARNEEIGRGWMSSLTTERLSHARNEVEVLRRDKLELRSRVGELEKRIEEYRLLEKDRDGALQDAREWKAKFERLDEALRLLTRQISRPPNAEGGGGDDGEGKGGKGVEVVDGTAGSSAQETEKDEVTKPSQDTSAATPPAENGGIVIPSETDKKKEVSNNTQHRHKGNGAKPSSTFAVVSEEDKLLSRLDLSGTHFSSLSNACDRLRENLRLTSIEANDAVFDLNSANRRVSTVEGRMAKAEHELCKLWEENCTLRDSLKKKKRERRVLVREVRSLIAAAEKEREMAKNEPAVPNGSNPGANGVDHRRPEPQDRLLPPPPPAGPQSSANSSDHEGLPPPIGNEERRLILELEEHVMSSLRLHEQFMSSTSSHGGGSVSGAAENNGQAPKRNSFNQQQQPSAAASAAEKRPPSRGSDTASSVASSAATMKVTNNTIGEGEDKSTVEGKGNLQFGSELAPKDDSSDPLPAGDGESVDEEKGSDNKKGVTSRPLSPLLPTRLSLIDMESGGEGVRRDVESGRKKEPPAADESSSTGVELGEDREEELLFDVDINGNDTSTDSAYTLSHPTADEALMTARGGVGKFASSRQEKNVGSAASLREDPKLLGGGLPHKTAPSLPQSVPQSLPPFHCPESTTSRLARFVRDAAAGSSGLLDISMSTQSSDDEERKKHPLLKLDEDDIDEEEDTASVPPHLCSSSSQSESSKSGTPPVVTESGSATSRLACPLADVVHTGKGNGLPSSDPDPAGEDGRVYHLTFYTRKIGLQFQKVPAPSPRLGSRGALAEAMTADVPGGGGGRPGGTAAELRRVAAISQKAKSSHPHQKGAANDDERETVCQVATPLDAVLVCGFHGFDDSNSGNKPKLGARLVAFDGISVEVGRWTFESVRKAIHARGRPLTLSFRNDFLNTKQRAILTRAVREVDSAVPRPRPTVQYRTQPRNSQQATTTELHHGDRDRSRREHINVASMSPAGPKVARRPSHENMQCHRPHPSNRHPNQSDYNRSLRTPSSSPYGNRSLSDAGASSVFSSTLGPLVANLMSGLSPAASGSDSLRNGETFTPQYLRRGEPHNSLEKTSHHHDFQAGLL